MRYATKVATVSKKDISNCFPPLEYRKWLKITKPNSAAIIGSAVVIEDRVLVNPLSEIEIPCVGVIHIAQQNTCERYIQVSGHTIDAHTLGVNDSRLGDS